MPLLLVQPKYSLRIGKKNRFKIDVLLQLVYGSRYENVRIMCEMETHVSSKGSRVGT